MSEEQRRDEETEVEGHVIPTKGLNEEPSDEVEGHIFPTKGLNEEPSDEVEGHFHRHG